MAQTSQRNPLFKKEKKNFMTLYEGLDSKGLMYSSV